VARIVDDTIEQHLHNSDTFSFRSIEMKRHRKIASFVLNTIVLSSVWVFSSSCATTYPEDTPQQYNLLFAEHSAMKKRLPLIERENDVLTKENGNYQTQVRKLEDNNKKLTAELAATNEKYTRERAASDEQIKNLEISMQQLDEEKSDQITALNNAMLTQKETFTAERDQILKEEEQKEAILSGQLADKEKALENKSLEISLLSSAKADLEKTLENKALEITMLSSAKADLEKTLGDKALQITMLSSTKSDLEKALESKAQEISKLTAANKENLKRLNETNEMIASLKKARDKFMAELESAKAANADLVKTFNELYNQLQLKKDQSGTKI
jgi:chromosome segregation ATPase